MINVNQYISDLKDICNSQSNNVLNVEIMVTETCNLKCSYCFEGKTEESVFQIDGYFEDITTFIDNILNDNSLQHQFNLIQLDFWGGEPTINLNFLIKIIEYYKNNERVMYHLYSNGYNYINFFSYLDANKSWLIDKFNIQISYDGKAIHDKFRIAKSNQLTADSVMENIINVYNLGYKLSLKSTLPLDGLQYLYDVWNEFKTLNLNGYKLLYAPTIETHSLKINVKDYIIVFEEMMLKILKLEKEFFSNNQYYILSWLKTPVRHTGCSAGSNMLIINNNGNILPCHGCLYSKNQEQVKICNIRDDDCLSKISQSMLKFNVAQQKLKKCSLCPATYCAICNAISLDKSNKKSITEKWFDYNSQNNMCEYYRIFGLMHRTLLEV